MALKQCKLHYISLHLPQNNSIKASLNFSEKKEKKIFDETKNVSRRHRRSRSQRFYKEDTLKNFAKWTEKQIYLIFFFDKVVGLQVATLLKERLHCKCFPVKFAKLLRKSILHNTFRRLLLLTPRIPLKPYKEAIRRCSM